MPFYSAAYRHVPVNWVIAILNMFFGVWNVFSWCGERTWSFINALWYNLIGFDKYFIFMDNSPVPIPYWYFDGHSGHGAWLYDARNKVFTYCVDEGNNKTEHLPILAMALHAKKYNNENDEFDMCDWMENLKIYTHNERFPHPLQLLSAWSLSSRFWPATQPNSNSWLEVINSQTGDEERIDLIQNVKRHYWYDYEESDDEESDEEESDDEGEDWGVGSERSESPHEEEDGSEPHEEELPVSPASSDEEIIDDSIIESESLPIVEVDVNQLAEEKQLPKSPTSSVSSSDDSSNVMVEKEDIIPERNRMEEVD